MPKGKKNPPRGSKELLAFIHSRCIDGPGGCKLWTGAKTRGGDFAGRTFSENWYGSIRVHGKKFYTHRLVVECVMGRELGPNEEVDHILDCNTLCCAPDHVMAVSALENGQRAAYNTNKQLRDDREADTLTAALEEEQDVEFF